MTMTSKAAPVPANNDAQENDVEDFDNTKDDDQTAEVACPLPASSNKTLHVMHLISTFYNPIAAAYVDNNSIKSEDTTTMSNQLGREAATNISNETEGSLYGDL